MLSIFLNSYNKKVNKMRNLILYKVFKLFNQINSFIDVFRKKKKLIEDGPTKVTNNNFFSYCLFSKVLSTI